MSVTKVEDLVDFEDWLPRHGFLADYLIWTSGHEGPARFHLWTALTTMSSVLERNVYFDKGYYYVFPALWVILIAPTGRCRKTRSASIGINLVREVDVNILAEKITPEQLIHALCNRIILNGPQVQFNATGLIWASELAQFFGKQSYNEGLIQLLTDLADCPSTWSYETRAAGRVTLSNVSLTMLGCSTPDWLGDAIPQVAFGGGFLGRLIFVVQHKTPRHVPFPRRPAVQQRTDLIKFLKTLRTSKGEFTLSTDAENWYTTWYKVNRDPPIEDLRTAGYYERKPDHLLRLSMLVALSESPTSLVITEDNVKVAASLLDAIEPNMSSAVSQINASQTGRDAMRILDQLRRAGGRMLHQDLVRMNASFNSSRSVRDAVRTLMEGGLLEEEVNLNHHEYILTEGKNDGKPSPE